jgi:hypothetical protein
LEALAPADLSSLLEDAIKEVLDIDVYNQELAAEERDAAHIASVRQQVKSFLSTLNINPQ